MKINQLSFLLFTAVLLFSCGKTILPSDDDNEEETEKPSPSHSPNEAKIYTVSEFIKGDFGNNGVWVHGYIVGACKRSIKQAEWEAPFTYDSAILLADAPEETEPENVISIQMVNKQMKEEISLAANPQNYGKHKINDYGRRNEIRVKYNSRDYNKGSEFISSAIIIYFMFTRTYIMKIT